MRVSHGSRTHSVSLQGSVLLRHQDVVSFQGSKVVMTPLWFHTGYRQEARSASERGADHAE